MNVVILTTDAGGGHRSVARALAAGFGEVGGPRCHVEIVDVASYAPFPLSRVREVYAFMARFPPLYDAFFDVTNQAPVHALDAPAVGLAMEAGLRRLLRDHAPDIVVATHPMGAPALSSVLYRRRQSLPYYTVVTDYGALHTWWAYPFGELWFAPCQETAAHLVGAGIPPGRVVVSGYPVRPNFARPTRAPAELRRALGLEPERFTALLTGGAEGLGPVEEMVQALAGAPGPWQLIVIAGRNQSVRERLDAQAGSWAVPVRVEGLVDDMPGYMHAADVLLSKAGASTLSEGLTCGLPALLTSALPGQEEENARHFERTGAGRRVSSPGGARAALEELAAPGSPSLQAMLSAARRETRPLASLEIAERVLSGGTAVAGPPLPPPFLLQRPRTRRQRAARQREPR